MTIRILLTIIAAIGFASWVAMPSLHEQATPELETATLAQATTVPRPANAFVGPTRPVSLPTPQRSNTPPRSGEESHWAFQPLSRPVVPRSELSHPIDAFLTAAPTTSTEVAGEITEPVAASFGPGRPERQLTPPADARTLVRRLWFDVLGLPPTIADVDALKYEHVEWSDLVDDVLDRPQFGERWARHWLDVARYADSNGYEYDEVRWNAYPYRDWVIRAINEDLPYDDFVRWQVAGDELLEDEQSERSVDAMTATGFLVAGPHNTFFPQEVERYDELDDVIHTVGQAFLGLSIGCARCHDHMTEPITQREYYQLVAVFQSTKRSDRFLTPDRGVSYMAATSELRKAEARAQQILEIAARDAKIDDLEEGLFSEDDKDLLKAPLDPNDKRQAELLRDAGTRLQVYDSDTESATPRAEHAEEYAQLIDEIDELAAKAPDLPPTTLAVVGSEVTPCWLLENGNVAWKGDQVEPGFLSCIGNAFATEWQAWDRDAANISQAKPRSALAYWLTDVKHGAGALVARVAVNRVWQHYFGKGLVTTPSNFGLSGDPPQDAQLLDYLAAELVDHHWSLKHIHRLIVTSGTYRQSSFTTFGQPLTYGHEFFASLATDDLAYPLQPRRLDGEVIRDAVYAVAGNLNAQMYGPPVQPPIPSEAVFKAGEQDEDTWPRDAADDAQNWRRSIYIQHRRSNPFPLLALFGEPEAGASCAARSSSVVPTQTLALWNEPWLRRQADELANELSQANDDPVDAAYRRVLQRDPIVGEKSSAEAFVAEVDLTSLVHALLVSNEFLYLD